MVFPIKYRQKIYQVNSLTELNLDFKPEILKQKPKQNKANIQKSRIEQISKPGGAPPLNEGIPCPYLSLLTAHILNPWQIDQNGAHLFHKTVNVEVLNRCFG